jgi:hypothetical protein
MGNSLFSKKQFTVDEIVNSPSFFLPTKKKKLLPRGWEMRAWLSFQLGIFDIFKLT